MADVALLRSDFTLLRSDFTAMLLAFKLDLTIRMGIIGAAIVAILASIKFFG